MHNGKPDRRREGGAEVWSRFRKAHREAAEIEYQTISSLEPLLLVLYAKNSWSLSDPDLGDAGNGMQGHIRYVLRCTVR